jgi:acetoin utilization protein AcuB
MALAISKVQKEKTKMKPIPTVQKYMTVLPHTIGFDQTIAKAKEMMREYGIRHLPVLKGGKLVGILSERDVNFVLTFKDTDADKTTVDEIFTPTPYVTSPGAHLDEVVAHMAEKKYGSALVVDNNKLVGILTEIDALNAFSDLLRSRLKG